MIPTYYQKTLCVVDLKSSSGEDVTQGFMGDSNALFQISLISHNQKEHESKDRV